MFVAQPLSSVKGITGKDVMLMCRLASSDEHPPKVSYQWYRGERRNSNDFKFLPEQKCNILHLSSELQASLRQRDLAVVSLVAVCVCVCVCVCCAHACVFICMCAHAFCCLLVHRTGS